MTEHRTPGSYRSPEQIEHDRRVGALLRRARQDRGLSLRQLSAAMLASGRAGWDHTRIYHLEHGQRSAQLYELTALAEVLDVDPGVLLPALAGSQITARQRQRRAALADANTVLDPEVDARIEHLQQLCTRLQAVGQPRWDYDLLSQVIFGSEQLEQAIQLAESELEQLHEAPPEPASAAV